MIGRTLSHHKVLEKIDEGGMARSESALGERPNQRPTHDEGRQGSYLWNLSHATIFETMKFTVVLSPQASGGFSAVCPALPGCISQGVSLEESLTNIREAIELCLDVRKEEGFEPLIETPELVAEEVRACLKDRTEEGLPLTIETHVVEVEAEVAA